MRKGARSLPEAFSHAWRGFHYAWATQPNLRLHMAGALTVMLLARWLELPPYQVLPVWLAVGLVICVELLNTAVEAVVDLASDQIHPLARRAKDVAAGAVLWAVVVAAVLGIVVFGPHVPRLPAVLGHRFATAPGETAAGGAAVLLLMAMGVGRRRRG